MTVAYYRSPILKAFIIFFTYILASVLPGKAQGLWTVELKEFKADSKNGNVGLTWQTASEENLMQFEVEFSTDGRYFKNIGFIPARNNINGDLYGFENIVWYTDSAFYRLKIVDKNKKWIYTDPILHHINKTTAFFVYPSVITTGILNIFINDPFNSLQVVNMNGVVMLNQSLSGKTGRINIPLSRNMSGGMYIVQLVNKERAITQKVMIQ